MPLSSFYPPLRSPLCIPSPPPTLLDCWMSPLQSLCHLGAFIFTLTFPRAIISTPHTCIVRAPKSHNKPVCGGTSTNSLLLLQGKESDQTKCMCGYYVIKPKKIADIILPVEFLLCWRDWESHLSSTARHVQLIVRGPHSDALSWQ